MKQFLVQLALCLASLGSFAQISQDQVVVFDLKEEIGPSSSIITLKAIARAEEIDAKFIVVHMNTFGGLVDNADEVRSALLATPIPTCVFIDNNAASAGSLISLACDSIYMRKGSTIGATTVVNLDGTRALDKHQSYMRRQMRSTAESHGKITKIINGDTQVVYRRNPDIAEGMVDERIVVEGLDDSTKIITLTAIDALEWGYCENIADSLSQVLEFLGMSSAIIVKVTPTALDTFLSFLDDPVTKYILFIIIMLGIVLIGLEIFVIPGFGVAGISGIVLLVLGILLSILTSIHFDLADGDNTKLKMVLTIMVFGILAFGVLAYLFGGKILRSRLFRLVVNEDTISAKVDVQLEDTNIDSLVGQTGQTSTALRPMGRVNINGTTFESKTNGEFIDRGTKVEVISIENRYLVVKTI
ncbi:MAG: hypothetical protein COA58_03540 [Bacteroidetes bacterium]|nr:MAG: hypothetical protein COA58_03540 [Bacteroidota bacterium]